MLSGHYRLRQYIGLAIATFVIDIRFTVRKQYHCVFILVAVSFILGFSQYANALI